MCEKLIVEVFEVELLTSVERSAVRLVAESKAGREL